MSDDREERKEWVKQYGKNGFKKKLASSEASLKTGI
jgi:hypothetical protein